jgi:asparagine synthase (glutamine-hydrolysing)
VPIGVFLSGGVDSSVITALLRKNSNSDINTFSMGFAVDKFDESAYAREVADKFDTHHIEFNIDYDFKNDIESIITSYDEPFADPSIIPSYYLAKETSQYVKVVLGGDGGDEVFGGYKRYNIHSRNNFLNYLPNKLFDLNNYLLQQTPYGIYKKQGWGRFNRSLEYFANSFIDGYYLRVANFTQKDIYALMGKWGETIWSDHINKILANSKLDNLNKITLIDQLTHLPEYILNKSDISGMSHSLEIRSPFTDYKLVEFVNNLPAKYKNNKSLLKEIAIKNGVPKDIVYRKKMGFTPPLRKWTADIKDNIGDVLFSDNLSFLNREVLQDIYDFHYKNNEILASKIWGLYVLGVWLKYYIK